MPFIPALPATSVFRQLALWLLAAAGMLALSAPALAEDDFLPVKSAYKVTVGAEPNVLVVNFEVAPGYYLYRDRLGFESATPGVTLGKPALPVGLDHEDEFFGKQVIYRDVVRIGVPVTFTSQPQDFDVKVKLQGCADAGLCYPPQTWPVRVTWPATMAGSGEKQVPAAAVPASTGKKDGFSLRALFGSGAKSDADFLPVDQAFVLSATSPARDRVTLRWDVADDYYLYRDKFSVKTAATDVQLGQPSIPGGETKHDEYFGEQVVFHREMVADVPVVAAAGVREVPLEITYQGCADAGLCYPPTRKMIVVRLASTQAVATAGSVAGDGAKPMRSEQDRFSDVVREGSLLAMFGIFLVAGLGLALTPCVWPMVPILSGIIVGAGSGTPVSRGRALALSGAYVFGMAATYAIAGAAFALAGQQAQAFFQKPWMIVLFAGLFVWLALGMFGVFTLQAPAWLQERVNRLTGQQKQGTLLGTAVVGSLSSLIVTACVAPPLVGSLAVISQTGDVVRGGLALFALGIGMGAPLLLVGASAGQFLPKAGAWMDTVKQFFGVLMLGVAIWMIGRIVPAPVTLGLWAVLAFVTGYWLLAMGAGATVVRRAIGALAAIYGVMLLAGALSGATDPLQPLAPFTSPGVATTGTAGNAAHKASFTRIKSAADLDAAIAAAQAEGKTVMLDFYADWCVSCKEMEKYTFPAPAVQAALANTVKLQADVTANDEVDQALMQRFGILGPPSILFFGTDGVEKPDYRVVGFKPAEDFAPHIQQAFGGHST
jgi:thiol:disulfide interchange protein DsbD